MRVYRLENPNGEGPYRSEHPLNEALRAAHSFDSERPSPFGRGEPWAGRRFSFNRENEVFGFLYLEDLRRWFDGWVEPLQEHGFSIVTYDIPDHLAGDILLGNSGQVAFVKPFVPAMPCAPDLDLLGVSL